MSEQKTFTPQILRVIDASLNRAAEGLRFLEDTARFVLNDAVMTKQLKELRHALIPTDTEFQKRLIQYRNAVGDIGADNDIKESKDIQAAVVANSRRVQESLRTLEETSKVTDEVAPLSSEKFLHARFETYTIEKNLLGKLSRQNSVKLVKGLYAIIDTPSLKNMNHLEMTRLLIDSGVKIIQLRDKSTPKKELLPIAQDMQEMCTGNNALFIMNDALDIALAIGADGIHIGQEDIPVATARRLLPLDTVIGCSVFNEEQARQAIIDGADYVGVGAIFPTQSKDTVVLGIEQLKKIKQAVNVPVVAIGGINIDNIEEVIEAGADSAAIISALLAADSPAEVASKIMSKFED